MKKLFFIFLFISGAFASKAQNYSADAQATKMLKEFYTVHCKIWSIKPPPPPKMLDDKLDSLQKKYCTQKLRKKAKEWLGDGHDLFTNDWGIDIESLNTMTIVKEPTQGNTYLVSYIVVAYPQSPVKPVKEHIILHVTLTKENGELRIASVKDSTTRLT